MLSTLNTSELRHDLLAFVVWGDKTAEVAAMVERLWTEARRKVAMEGRCRVCKAASPLHAAHVIGRSFDKKIGPKGERNVDPADIVPLCGFPKDDSCHEQYDKHRLDLLPYLTLEEQAAAVAHVGIERARNRICSIEKALR